MVAVMGMEDLFDTTLDKYLKLHVFQFLDRRSMVKISQVSKAWRRLSFRNWKSITYCSHNPNNECHLPNLSDAIVQAITDRSCKYIRGLHICHAESITNEAFHNVPRCKNLRYLLIAACKSVDDSGAAALFSDLDQLRFLALVETSITKLEPFSKSSQLRTLRYKNNRLASAEDRYPMFDATIFSHFLHLTHIDIHGATFKKLPTSSSSLFTELSALTSLAYLKLANCAFCLDDFAMLGKCTALQKLYFFNEGDRVKDAHLEAFCQLTRLQKLTFGPFDEHNFTGEGLVHLENCQQLQKLIFFRCAGLEGKNLAPLNQLKKLAYLDVSRSDLDIQGCQSIFTLPNLKELLVQLQPNVPHEALLDIKQCSSTLQCLRLYSFGASLTDLSLCAIASLRKLSSLVLYSESFEPAVARTEGFTALAHLPNLIVLEFHNFSFLDNDCAAMFANTPRLAKLVIRNCKCVTPDVVKSLGSSSSLQEVFLACSDYTPAEFVVGKMKVLISGE